MISFEKVFINERHSFYDLLSLAEFHIVCICLVEGSLLYRHVGEWISDNSKLKVVDGNSTRFWHDVQMGDSFLRSRFPRLFYIVATNPNVLVSSRGMSLRNPLEETCVRLGLTQKCLSSPS